MFHMLGFALSLFILWISLPGYELNGVDVAQLHRTALQQSLRRDYAAAIENLKRVVEIDPSSALYWNDLGVTELRYGQLSSARYHLMTALRIDPSFEIAKENLVEVNSFLSQDAESNPQIFQQTHNLRCLKRRRMADLFRLDKEGMRRVLDFPFIIPAHKRFKKRIESRHAQFSFENIRHFYGHVLVDFYPHSMSFSSVQPAFVTMNRSLDDVMAYRKKHSAHHSLSGPYVQWNMDHGSFNEIVAGSDILIPPLLDDRHWLPMCFPDRGELSEYLRKTHWKMLLIGERNAGMFNHQDTLRAASWQIVGSKTWHICDPTQSRLMYEAGSVDAFKPDYDQFPLFKNASCFQEILKPGEYIYYPTDYWHQTLNNRSPSVSISSSVLSFNNYQKVAEELDKECAGRGSIFAPTGNTCAMLKKCHAIWKDMFARSGSIPQRKLATDHEL